MNIKPEDHTWRSQRHERAYRLRHDNGLSYARIGVEVGCSAETARKLVATALTPLSAQTNRGAKRKRTAAGRRTVSIRLSTTLIAALRLAGDRNGTTIAAEIEARLLKTLLSDGLLTESDVAP